MAWLDIWCYPTHIRISLARTKAKVCVYGKWGLCSRWACDTATTDQRRGRGFPQLKGGEVTHYPVFDVLTFLVVIVALFDWIESAIYKVKVVVVSIDTVIILCMWQCNTDCLEATHGHTLKLASQRFGFRSRMQVQIAHLSGHFQHPLHIASCRNSYR